MHVIAAPTGSGKTRAAARHVAGGSACWLADRHEDVDAAVAAIEDFGGQVGRTLPLDGELDGVPNCLHPETIGWWQAKGYNYRAGFCKVVTKKKGPCCERRGETGACPYLGAIADLRDAPIIVTTKAFARRPGFFSAWGNSKRETVVIDEDPIDALRPAVPISREDLTHYLRVLRELIRHFDEFGEDAAAAEARRSERVAQWCFEQMNRQPADGQPAPVPVPVHLRPSRAVLSKTKTDRAQGRKELIRALHRRMRRDPVGMVRNVCRDLTSMLNRAAARTVFVTSNQVLFHLRLDVPRTRDVYVLDATANPELLRPIFAPRRVEVLCDRRVRPAGRVVQFMDFNGPRSYLNRLPGKLVRIIDALGDRHAEGRIVLISHKSCVEGLARTSRHAGRIIVAHFGDLRGRNDLEARPDRPIACHIVAGSPKTTEEDRRQLALAVYGRDILPFGDLQQVRRTVLGRSPVETDREGFRAWELNVRAGYADPRMQAVYDHTVTAELTHAADRARVLIHRQAVVYLLTNEPCPKLWFAERCYAGEFLDLSPEPRADFERAYDAYAATAKALLDGGQPVGNADVERALGRGAGWGKRYWRKFLSENGDALEGDRKKRWKGP